ncbi:ribosomal protein S18-alanine N-acetyltransferase [Palleronia abyssalis]|uniref:[Ribosomal protein bS18]-alanine N-acetyltransferase n=1 Tax=Palleronia abyssalis TaxID=1501240 RepID=A0A2R8C1G3_9RHOB|nr:ribosomal protein S18-alanine N-acetyltransferase [Palleronia abyssalis]SPJ26248.1 Ribosomal-protein-alanine acetyltransferase [Palleronia abyssalis]
MTDAELAAIHAAAMSLPRPWSESEIGSLRLMPGSIESVRPEGFALGRHVLDEAELLTIAVHPDHRRRGFARALLRNFHGKAKSAGADVCHLEVAASNAAARALYTSEGYRESGHRRGYYTEASPPIDAIVMVLQL